MTLTPSMSKETEWLRKIKGSSGKRVSLLSQEHESIENKEEPVSLATETSLNDNKETKDFSKVAGMDNLKKLVIEGFINILKNPTKAAHYGLSVPNILLYGPAGCGKTFFAE